MRKILWGFIFISILHTVSILTNDADNAAADKDEKIAFQHDPVELSMFDDIDIEFSPEEIDAYQHAQPPSRPLILMREIGIALYLRAMSIYNFFGAVLVGLKKVLTGHEREA
ncbi:MAG: hypothetical protein AB7R69_03730 [Candidatus Babeliales bacterium]